MVETTLLVAMLFGLQVICSLYLQGTKNFDEYRAAVCADVALVVGPTCVALFCEKSHNEVLALWIVAALNAAGLMAATVIRIYRKNN